MSVLCTVKVFERLTEIDDFRVKEWIPDFLPKTADDPVVPPEVSYPESIEVHLQLCNQRLPSFDTACRVERSTMAGVSCEKLVGAEAGEEDAGVRSVGLWGEGVGRRGNTDTAGCKVERNCDALWKNISQLVVTGQREMGRLARS